MLTLQLSGFSQQSVPTPGEAPGRDTAARPHTYQEIIIRQQTDKDDKVTVEIKNGELFINGKPASEYQDGNLVITKRKLLKSKNGSVMMDDGDMYMSPFREQWDWKDMAPQMQNKAFLGVTSMRQENGPAGARIAEVSPGSAAEKAGLKSGDLITRLDELKIEGPEDLSHAVGKYAPEDKVTITYTRDGKEQKVTGELGKGKPATVEPMSFYNLQMPDMKELQKVQWPNEFRQYMGNSLKFGIRAQDAEDGKGVKVVDVDDESTAAKAGIKEGDVITRFDGKDINSVTALTEAARAAREKVSIKVTITRDGKVQEIEVHVPRLLRTADL